jgi:hypothetical protein
LSHDVSVRLRLSRGTLREFALAGTVDVDTGVGVGVEVDVIGRGGIIMAETSDWRVGSGSPRRSALEAREKTVK